MIAVARSGSLKSTLYQVIYRANMVLNQGYHRQKLARKNILSLLFLSLFSLKWWLSRTECPPRRRYQAPGEGGSCSAAPVFKTICLGSWNVCPTLVSHPLRHYPEPLLWSWLSTGSLLSWVMSCISPEAMCCPNGRPVRKAKKMIWNFINSSSTRNFI